MSTIVLNKLLSGLARYGYDSLNSPVNQSSIEKLLAGVPFLDAKLFLIRLSLMDLPTDLSHWVIALSYNKLSSYKEKYKWSDQDLRSVLNEILFYNERYQNYNNITLRRSILALYY